MNITLFAESVFQSLKIFISNGVKQAMSSCLPLFLLLFNAVTNASASYSFLLYY